LREELLEAFGGLDPRSGEVAFHSSVTGGLVDTAGLDGGYWYRNLRETVRFGDVLGGLVEGGQRAFVEVGPHPVLALSVESVAESVGRDDVAVVSTLRRGEGGPRRFGLSLAQAHAAGVEVDWGRFYAATGAKRVRLPGYPFQRKRYWIDARPPNDGGLGAAGLARAEHPLLGAAIELPDQGWLFTGRVSLQTSPWLADHAVAGAVLFAGAAFLDLALHAACHAGLDTVEELVIQTPLTLPPASAIDVQVAIAPAQPHNRRAISIHSRAPDSDHWTLHATGTLTNTPQNTPRPAPQPWPPKHAQPIDLTHLYDHLADTGHHYGPAFQRLTAAWRDKNHTYTQTALPPNQPNHHQLHPALLDAALHTTIHNDGPAAGARLPFSFSDVRLGEARGASELRVTIAAAGENLAVEITDAAGAPACSIGSIASRPIDPAVLGAGPAGPGSLLAVDWSAVEPGERHDGDVEVVECTPGRGQEDPAAAARAESAALLSRLRAFVDVDAGRDADARLAVVTTGALGVAPGESPDLVQAALWGLVRSAQSEHPGRFVLVDDDGSDASREVLGAALATGEPQLALRDGAILAPRVTPVDAAAGRLSLPSGSWRLDARPRGTLDGLALAPDSRPTAPLGPNEVRIDMRAAGLNFRDVMVALDFDVPGDGSLGGEGAGVVAEVGSAVTDLAAGDRVMGAIDEAFGSSAVADRRLVAAIPASWTFRQAAAMPAAFLTAYTALVDVANLEAGQRVLIHAGAGGVGMAAIQLANHLGAEVFATASPSKWYALRSLGLGEDRIASSRDPAFAERIARAVGEPGLDVVLNSLAGEYVDASLKLLRPGGRFVELGKTDLRDPERVAAEHEGVAYRAFDLFDVDPDRVAATLATLIGLFERKELRHLPVASWDLRRTPEAFRHLREGRNVGKVVLAVPRAIDPGATILITGGTGGLGALVARHLAERHGARRLLLASRRGPDAEGAAELRADLEALGAHVDVVACDVAERAQVAGLLASIPEEHPLGAVVHAAGALADATIDSLGDDDLERVFAPKAAGAWNLHQLTRDRDLSAFVLFSAMAGIVGSPGQANYAAANTFLDALAQRRHAEGLPATSIAWGLWERQSAMTAGLRDADRQRMRRSGVEQLSDEQGLALFDAALSVDRPVVLGLRPAAARAHGLLRSSAARSPRVPLAARLAALDPDERQDAMLDLVRREAAAVLGHGAPEAISTTRAFMDAGFDSLAAVELRNRLHDATGLRLDATLVFDYQTPTELAEYLATKPRELEEAR
jgi:NADPH:quinone reductase-like Zn-dependent oxidoreductase/acyl carrier protein